MYCLALLSFAVNVLSEINNAPTVSDYPQVTSIELELNGTLLPRQVYHVLSWNTNFPIPANTYVKVKNQIVAGNPEQRTSDILPVETNIPLHIM